MKVTLISHTQNAEDLLLFTKSTRLTLSPGLMEDIQSWSDEHKAAELEYMANTVPSSWEFVDYTFLIEGVSRAFTHQFVRSRNASYAQQTMRVLEMGDFDYVYTDKIAADKAAKDVVDECLSQIKFAYNKLLKMGVAAEDARGVLPTNISTNIVAKFNLRSLVDLVKSRTGGRTQGEYQKVASAMANAVLAVHPWAGKFFFKEGRDYFAEIEKFAEEEYGGDLLKKGRLLKIVDMMRKA